MNWTLGSRRAVITQVLLMRQISRLGYPWPQIDDIVLWFHAFWAKFVEVFLYLMEDSNGVGFTWTESKELMTNVLLFQHVRRARFQKSLTSNKTLTLGFISGSQSASTPTWSPHQLKLRRNYAISDLNMVRAAWSKVVEDARKKSKTCTFIGRRETAIPCHYKSRKYIFYLIDTLTRGTNKTWFIFPWK